MREKLEKIIDAYKELEAKLGDPSVIANQAEYNKLAKSYSDQGPLVKKSREYIQCLDDLVAAKEMLSDSDMKEFAQEEIAGIEAKLPSLEEEIKFMLVPPILPTKKTLLSKFVLELVATKRQFSRVICIPCIRVLLPSKGGSVKPWMFILPMRVDTKKSNSKF